MVKILERFGWGWPTTPGPVSFAFIKTDIDNQRRIVQSLLDQIEKLDELVQQAPTDDERRRLEALKMGLVSATRDLAQNASFTANTATWVLSTA